MADTLTTQDTLILCTEMVQALKADDITILDLRAVSDFTDHFVICAGNSDVHVRAIADAVLEGMKERGSRALHIEGYDARKWILIDFVDVVVHVMLPDERTFYGLERLWGDAPLIEIQEGTDVKAAIRDALETTQESAG